ncbi:MAG TPA: (2Fe-2S)-binding protein [Candidatus Krumholzibacteria bacterium]|nr:(2Fe-2S)-binding protein [Candidatus Krumholzibacteria bacterium]
MIICHCRGITDRDVQAAIDRGASSMRQVTCHGPAKGCCGSCGTTIRGMLCESLQTSDHPGSESA